MDTGICIEDVVQTLIDLNLAHTGQSINEINFRQQEIRGRRRQHNQYDNNNNNLDGSSVLIINTDVLRAALNHISTSNFTSRDCYFYA